MDPNLLTSIIAAATALVLIIHLWNEGDPYYSNGGRATYVQFLLHDACNELFHEVHKFKLPHL